MSKNLAVSSNNFTLLLRVRYGECDAQEVVFNARYADYIDIAMTEYFRSAVGGFQALLSKGLDNQVVSLHIDWHSPAKFDDVLAIRVFPAKVGNTSYQFELDVRQSKTQILVAKGAITYVLVDSTNYTKTPVPLWLRDALSAPKHKLSLVNHAGA